MSFQILSFGQCSSVGIQISSSDTNQIQLYHAGFFNIDSGYANVCEWEVTTFQGDVVHQATTSGQWEDQSFSLFNHSVPITDSMEVTLFITNPIVGIACSIVDTIFWEETEVLPGAFIGNWSILGDYGGEENELITALDGIQSRKEVEIIPSLVTDQFIIRNIDENFSVSIYDSKGQLVLEKANVNTQQHFDISWVPPGLYFTNVYNSNGELIAIKKMVKI